MSNKFDTIYVKNEAVQREWLLVDVSSQCLGRFAYRIAHLLRGKHKTLFQPSVDNGDYVVVINASKISLSGNKEKDKIHYWYTGYPGGIKSVTAGEMRQNHPDRLIYLAVKRMMPKGKLRRAMLKKLFLYPAQTHDQTAQKPKLVEIK